MRAWSRRVLDDRQSGLWDGVRVSSRSFAKDIDAELRVRAVPERAAWIGERLVAVTYFGTRPRSAAPPRDEV
jgi:hypothetical protein